MKFQYFREFSALASGKRHYRNLHMETIPFKCICCDQMFKNDVAYVLHLKKIHDVTVTKKQIDAARKIEMDGGDFLLEISEKMVVSFLEIKFSQKKLHIFKSELFEVNKNFLKNPSKLELKEKYSPT